MEYTFSLGQKGNIAKENWEGKSFLDKVVTTPFLDVRENNNKIIKNLICFC